MAASETTICNLALGKLGEPAIMSLEDASPSARACKLQYETTRDEVLRSHSWNFAIKRATLSALSEAPQSGWAVQYQLPSDYLRLLQLNGFEADERRDLWEIEGRKLLTDEESAKIRYVYRVADANLFDALFVRALATKLAAEIAKPVTGSDSAAGTLMTEYERITGPIARTSNALEGRPKRKLPWVESDLVRSRYGY